MAQKERTAFALRLRMLRKQKRLRQEDVAKQLNLSRTAYTKYETKGTEPAQERLIELAKIYDVTVDYLLGKDGEDPVAVLQDNASMVALSPQEQELIALFRRLTETQQQLLLQTERELLGVPHEKA